MNGEGSHDTLLGTNELSAADNSLERKSQFSTEVRLFEGFPGSTGQLFMCSQEQKKLDSEGCKETNK